MANPENIIGHQFKPGQSGNPGGYSRKARLTTALIKRLDEKGLDDEFVKAGMDAALQGDFHFWRYIFDRIDGPMKPEDDASEGTLKELVDEAEKRAISRSQGAIDEPVEPVP